MWGQLDVRGGVVGDERDSRWKERRGGGKQKTGGRKKRLRMREKERERERDGEEEKETQRRRMDRDGEIGVCIYGRYIARLAEGTS